MADFFIHVRRLAIALQRGKQIFIRDFLSRQAFFNICGEMFFYFISKYYNCCYSHEGVFIVCLDCHLYGYLAACILLLLWES